MLAMIAGSLVDERNALLTLAPLRVYFNGRGIAKVLLGLCRGKKLHDKRDAEAEKSAKRDIDRTLKERNADG